jgi:hypothetical protein
MNKARISLCILAVLFVSRCNSLAWSSPGHMVIAAIAYRELSANEKINVNELLKHHPNYEQWKAIYIASNSDFDFDTFIFMRASIWPDEIRRRGNPYDHPEWHYIDYPLESPMFLVKPSPAPTNDILYGINQSEGILKNTNNSPEIRAAYLSWLIHLTGDIHQPLHCATLVNQDYPAPVGDKGGNNFFVRPAEAPVNLHSIWDKALGATVNIRLQFNYATEICAEHSRADFSQLSEHKTAESWSIESRAIAIEDGYLRGKLNGSKEAVNAPPLPDGYLKQMKAIAGQQAALAGYRLADEIKKYAQ